MANSCSVSSYLIVWIAERVAIRFGERRCCLPHGLPFRNKKYYAADAKVDFRDGLRGDAGLRMCQGAA